MEEQEELSLLEKIKYLEFEIHIGKTKIKLKEQRLEKLRMEYLSEQLEDRANDSVLLYIMKQSEKNNHYRK